MKKISLLGKGLEIKTITSPLDLFQSSAAIVVGCIDDKDWGYHEEYLQSFLQAFVENTLRACEPRELVLVCRIKNQSTKISVITKLYEKIIKEFEDAHENVKLVKVGSIFLISRRRV